MTESRNHAGDLEDALVSLGRWLDLPAEPELAEAVRAHLEAHPKEEGRRVPRLPRRSTFERLRPALGIAAAMIAIVGVVLVFSPTTRSAVADWIGLDGVRITYGNAPKEPIATDLLLGERLGLDQARSRAGFPIRVPAALGVPDDVFVKEDRPGARVSLVYRATDDLPPTDQTGVGVLIGQFQATIERDILVKKIISAGGFVEEVEVAGTSGYWLAGGPHIIAYLDENGAIREDQVRLAGNTLLWQRDGIVYRIESNRSQMRSIEIAESMF